MAGHPRGCIIDNWWFNRYHAYGATSSCKKLCWWYCLVLPRWYGISALQRKPSLSKIASISLSKYFQCHYWGFSTSLQYIQYPNHAMKREPLALIQKKPSPSRYTIRKRKKPPSLSLVCCWGLALIQSCCWRKILLVFPKRSKRTNFAARFL